MTLRSTILDDATGVFLNVDDFAEAVTYHPHNHPGEATREARSINAMVFRGSIEQLVEDGIVYKPTWEVHVANDSTYGIASSEIDVGRDQIAIPPREGKTADRVTIRNITDHDHGMLILECR